jgi:thioredoxin 1
MPTEPIELKTPGEFAEYIKKYKVIVVKVTTRWCGPCKRVAPLVNQLYAGMPDNVAMVVVDGEAGGALRRALKVKQYPTFLNFVGGQLHDSCIGAGEAAVTRFFVKTAERASK